jgi:enterochelin esterase-like enzyme
MFERMLMAVILLCFSIPCFSQKLYQSKTFQSTYLKGEFKYVVYLPPKYNEETQKRYPVIYWYTGGSSSLDRVSEFLKHFDPAVKSGQVKPAIVVAPWPKSGSWYTDSSSWMIESAIIKEFIPHVEKTYRALTTRSARWLEGFSMGGYGASYHAFKYPELFSVLSVISGGLERVDENSANAYAKKNASKINGKTLIRLTVGEKEEHVAKNKFFHDYMTAAGIEHEFQIVPNAGHSPDQQYSNYKGDKMAIWKEAFKRLEKEDPKSSVTLKLNKGWNLISLPLEPSDQMIETLISTIVSKVQVIYAYTASGYISFIPGALNNKLTKLGAGHGFWIYMTDDAMLTISGSNTAVPIQLTAGWNLVGLRGDKSIAIVDALSSIAGKYLAVYKFDSGKNIYVGYAPGTLNDLTILKGGEGYWIYVTESVAWLI